MGLNILGKKRQSVEFVAEWLHSFQYVTCKQLLNVFKRVNTISGFLFKAGYAKKKKKMM